METIWHCGGGGGGGGGEEEHERGRHAVVHTASALW